MKINESINSGLENSNILKKYSTLQVSVIIKQLSSDTLGLIIAKSI